MKREILFHGKRVDNGQWVEGSLIGEDVIVGKIVDFEEDYFTTEFWYKVDTETVGQFTGITDINDIKIFEGDIAKYYNPYSKQWYTHIVKWDKMFASFGFFTQDSEWCKENDWLKIESIEVIGNIYDNKELLK